MENMVKVSRKVIQGSIWDEIGKVKIVQILISHGESAIHSIQFVYVVVEKPVPSEIHGEPHGSYFDMVMFDQPKEYLISVSGHYSNSKLVSITFGTNYRKYGPFGSKEVSGYENFAYNFQRKSSFGGFHGSVFNSCVHAIGIYVKPVGSFDETDIDTVTDTGNNTIEVI